jgi:drug/metabolite transporter (DMT)-like permease
MKECDVKFESVPIGGSQDYAAKSRVSPLAPKIVLAYCACAMIWGTTWYAIRVCVAPGAFAPFSGAALRFSLATCLFAALWFVWRGKLPVPPQSATIWIAICGLFNAFSYALTYTALQNVSGGLSAVLSATSPLMAALIASLTRVERLSKMALLGSIVAISGVLVVFFDRLQVSAAQASGAVLLILACVFNASAHTGMKRHARDVPALASNTLFFSSVAGALWIAAFASGTNCMPNPVPTNAAIALLYLTVIGTLCAFICYFYLLKHVRLSTAMSLSFVTPLVALLVDAACERRVNFTPLTYVGMAIVLIGVATSIAVQTRTEAASFPAKKLEEAMP